MYLYITSTCLSLDFECRWWDATTFVLALFVSNFGSIAQDAVQLKAPVVWLLKCQDSPPVTREEVAFEINYFGTGQSGSYWQQWAGNHGVTLSLILLHPETINSQNTKCGQNEKAKWVSMFLAFLANACQTQKQLCVEMDVKLTMPSRIVFPEVHPWSGADLIGRIVIGCHKRIF